MFGHLLPMITNLFSANLDQGRPESGSMKNEGKTFNVTKEDCRSFLALIIVNTVAIAYFTRIEGTKLLCTAFGLTALESYLWRDVDTKRIGKIITSTALSAMLLKLFSFWNSRPNQTAPFRAGNDRKGPPVVVVVNGPETRSSTSSSFTTTDSPATIVVSPASSDLKKVPAAASSLGERDQVTKLPKTVVVEDRTQASLSTNLSSLKKTNPVSIAFVGGSELTGEKEQGVQPAKTDHNSVKKPLETQTSTDPADMAEEYLKELKEDPSVKPTKTESCSMEFLRLQALYHQYTHRHNAKL